MVTCTGCSGRDTTGREQRGPWYAVAIRSDGITLSTLIAAPASASAQPAIFRPEIGVNGTGTGTGTRIRVIADQMRAVDAGRLGDFAGR